LIDPDPLQVSIVHDDLTLVSSTEHGLSRIDSGVSARFWALNQRVRSKYFGAKEAKELATANGQHQEIEHILFESPTKRVEWSDGVLYMRINVGGFESVEGEVRSPQGRPVKEDHRSLGHVTLIALNTRISYFRGIREIEDNENL
jgi:hypothetical protein